MSQMTEQESFMLYSALFLRMLKQYLYEKEPLWSIEAKGLFMTDFFSVDDISDCLKNNDSRCYDRKYISSLVDLEILPFSGVQFNLERTRLKVFFSSKVYQRDSDLEDYQICFTFREYTRPDSLQSHFLNMLLEEFTFNRLKNNFSNVFDYKFSTHLFERCHELLKSAFLDEFRKMIQNVT
jgi:hypothetical protein